jgi:uncharacterized alpha-E superfamily protein
MLSRVADSIFWLSRYIERAENVARFVDVNLQLMLDLPGATAGQWEALVHITGDYDWFVDRYGVANQENVIQFLTFDAEYPNSIVSCLRAARENARSVREIISCSMWEQVNRFYLMVMDAVRSWQRVMESPHDFFTEVKMASHLFVGVTDTTMSHGEGWHFCKLGRTLERADKTSRLLDVKYFLLRPAITDPTSMQFDDIQWSALLGSASAVEMYRQKHGSIEPDRVIDFLILDRDFPRAVHFCLLSAEESLHAISGTPMGMFHNHAERILGRLRSDFAFTQVEEIVAGGLHEFLDGLQDRLNLVGESIHDTFFALRAISGAVTGARSA